MKKLLLSVFCVLLASVAFSQKTTVTGRVTDSAGEPLIGASIITNDGIGTITDADGRYSIQAPAGGTLTVSFISYKTASAVLSGGRTEYNFVLQDDNEMLEETVVVGYGVQKKANLSGSVAQIEGKTLENRPIPNVSQGLQGLAAGITVTGSDGAPGQDGGTIRIRGVGTLNNASPYILVDGVETGNINSIDPQDIESISVLKDASSAAIYGSKASNGVILITTKRGKEGSLRVAYSGSVGVQNATMLMERMNSADAAFYYNKALERSGKSARFTDEEIQKFRSGSDPYNYPNTDWYKLGFKTGVETRHNVSVTGGTERARYMGSAGFLYQNGILANAGRQQFNARTNLDVDIVKNLTMHMNLAFIQNNYTDPSSAYAGGSSDQIIRQMNRIAPWIVNQYEDGQYGTISDGNPIAWLDSGMKVKYDNQNITGLLGLDYKIIKPLVLKGDVSYVTNQTRKDYFQKYIVYNDHKVSDPQKLEITNSKWSRLNFNLTLNYDQSFGKHNLKALAGWHGERYNYSEDYGYRKSFPNNELTDMDAGDASSQANSGYTRELTMVSGFGRINYDYDGRYLFEANFRADASSRFADGNRWGVFPSVSAAWRLTQEKWMRGASNVLSNLKIRASWGQLGNQDALSDYYPAMNTYNLSAGYPFDGNLSTGYYQSSYHLSTISWEKSTTWGAGVDFGFAFGLFGSVDYYNRITDGIIMDVSAPAEFALGAYKDNIGSMKNNGVEVTLGYNRQFGKDWTLNISGNFAYNHNEITNLGEGIDYIGSGNTRNAVGYEYGCYYMYRWTGKFFNSQEEADTYTAKYGNPFGKKFMAGDLIYDDANGDGRLNSDDRVYTGSSSMPKYTYNINAGFTWKNLDFSMMWQGVGDVNYIFNNEVLGNFSGDTGHPSTVWANSWSETNKNPIMPAVHELGNSASCQTKAMSTFWLWDTSYIRLKNVQLGYTFKFKNSGLKNLRIYYSGENIFTFHNLPFNTDPETTSERGSSYPLLCTHSFGVNLSF